MVICFKYEQMIKKLVYSLLTLVFSTGFGYAQTKTDSLKTVLTTTTDARTKLDLLDELTKELIRKNSDAQVTYLDQYLVLAKTLKEYDLMASKSRFLIQFYVYDNKIDKAKRLCDSLLTFKSLFKKESSEAHLLLKRAQFSYLAENYDTAIKDYSASAELFLKGGDSIFAADAIYYAGTSYDIKSDFIEAIKSYRKASNLYERLGDEAYVIRVGSEITGLYTQMGFIEKGIEERQRLLQKAIKTKDTLSIGQIMAQNMVDYYKLEDYETMYIQLNDFIDYSEDVRQADLKAYWNHIATIYKLIYHCKTNDIAMAKIYMQRLEALSANQDLSKYLETDILIAKEIFYDVTNDEVNHLPILERLSNIESTTRIEAQTRAREKLAKIYKRKGQLDKVVALNDINNRVKDSVYNAQKTNAFLFYQSEFEAEKKQNELLQQDATIKQLKTERVLAATKRNGLIIGLVSVFLVAIAYFYIRNRQKIKEQAYQNILLNNKVATKTEEINQLLTETIQHIKSKERIAENLQKLSNENEGITLKSIIADLKASKADNAKLMLIKQNIEQVNFEFIKQLKALHPDLTKTDVEICSLVRIGLSRKEVANLRNTSLEAVKTSRFRLKKKLNLSADEPLDDYINTL